MKKILVLIALIFPNFLEACPVEVALTFDDLPFVETPEGYSRLKLVEDIVAVLAKHLASREHNVFAKSL
jgi:hypothetical protein